MSLISTADLRQWMGIEAGDKQPNAKLDSLSSAIQDFVDSYTNRKLEAQTYRTDPMFCYLDGTGCSYIYAPQYPISYVTEVAIDADRVFDSATLVASADLFWYPSGKIVSEAGYFTKGRRNVRLDYIAGYAPVVGGTHNAAVSSYPIPMDLKQTMIEMCVESFKEGITAVHTVESQDPNVSPRFVQLLSQNSFWRNTLIKYKAFDVNFNFNEE